MKSIRVIQHGMRDHIIWGMRIPFTQILLVIYRQYLTIDYEKQRHRIGFFKNLN